MCINLSILAKFTQTRSRKIYLHKLWEFFLAGNSCRKFLWEMLREILQKISWEIQWEILQENLAGNCCEIILWENLVEQGGWEKANLRKAVIGGNLAFGIG